MATINVDAIMDKVYAYADSDKGQKKMDQTLDKYIRNNVSKTEAGSVVMTKSLMCELGDILVAGIVSAAQSCKLPASIMSHFSTLQRSEPQKNSDGSYSMEIFFSGDMSRPSLYPEKYGGVTNIVALFNSGYPLNGKSPEVISHVYGFWNGKNTYALGSRPGLHFIQSAINDFNDTYGGSYGVYAIALGVFDVG